MSAFALRYLLFTFLLVTPYIPGLEIKRRIVQNHY